jgi:hypothetical protein
MAASFVQPNLHQPRNYEILVLNLRFQTLDAFCGDTAALDKTRVIRMARSLVSAAYAILQRNMISVNKYHS